MTGVSAEPFPPGTDEMHVLQLYGGILARALIVKTPAIRP